MLQLSTLRRTLALVPLLAACSFAALAQGTSFSPSLSSSISDPLIGSSPNAGFNSSFDASTANLSNPSVRADVSDPTHAQLLGSTLSPFDNSYTDPQFQTSPQTGIVADARSTVGYVGFSIG